MNFQALLKRLAEYPGMFPPKNRRRVTWEDQRRQYAALWRDMPPALRTHWRAFLAYLLSLIIVMGFIATALVEQRGYGEAIALFVFGLLMCLPFILLAIAYRYRWFQTHRAAAKGCWTWPNIAAVLKRDRLRLMPIVIPLLSLEVFFVYHGVAPQFIGTPMAWFAMLFPLLLFGFIIYAYLSQNLEGHLK